MYRYVKHERLVVVQPKNGVLFKRDSRAPVLHLSFLSQNDDRKISFCRHGFRICRNYRPGSLVDNLYGRKTRCVMIFEGELLRFLWRCFYENQKVLGLFQTSRLSSSRFNGNFISLCPSIGKKFVNRSFSSFEGNRLGTFEFCSSFVRSVLV